MTHFQKVMSSNPVAVYLMDIWTFIHRRLVVLKIVLFVLKRTKLNKKRPGIANKSKYIKIVQKSLLERNK